MTKIKIFPPHMDQWENEQDWTDCTIYSNGEWKKGSFLWLSGESYNKLMKRYSIVEDAVFDVGLNHHYVGFRVWLCDLADYAYVGELELGDITEWFFFPGLKDMLDFLGYIAPRLQALGTMEWFEQWHEQTLKVERKESRKGFETMKEENSHGDR
jgi:hypothetical protein